MSTDILYRKSFIKIDNKRVIPFYESGSSNCTMYNNLTGREVLARDWCNDTFHTKGQIIINNDDLLKSIDDFRDRLLNGSNYTDDEFGWFTALRLTGKTTRGTTFNNYKNYYKTGIKKSKTIEEYAKYNIFFTIQPSVYFKFDENGIEKKPSVTFTSTEHMISVIEEYTNFYKDTKCYCHISVSPYMMERMFIVERCRNSRPRNGSTSMLKDFYTVMTEHGSYFVRNTKYGYKHSYFDVHRKFKTEKECDRFIDEQKKRGRILTKKHIIKE